MKSYDLVIVGAGPAGIACAVEAKLKNKTVLLLEKGDKISQSMRTFYKEGKRVDMAYKGYDEKNLSHIPFCDTHKEECLEMFENELKKHDIEVLFKAEVEKIMQDGDGLLITCSKGNFKASKAVIAIGRMGKPNKPDYKLPSSLSKLINYNANSVQEGEKILIIGGGNSAAEYAIDLCDKTKACLCYRRKEFARLNDINLKDINDCAINGRCELRMGVDIESVSDENAKPKVHFTDGSEVVYDRLIYAIGGSTPVDFLEKCGVLVDDKKVPIFNEHKESSAKNIFVAGDIATKNGACIIVALNDAVTINNA